MNVITGVNNVLRDGVIVLSSIGVLLEAFRFVRIDCIVILDDCHHPGEVVEQISGCFILRFANPSMFKLASVYVTNSALK